MTRRDLTAYIGVGLCLVGMLYALTRIGAAITWTPWLAVFGAGTVVGHGLGRAKQRRAHAWAVWKGHPR